MHPFETIILLLNLVALVTVFLPLRPNLRGVVRFLPVGIVALTIVQLIVEKHRWQMAPPYLLTVALFLLTLPGLLKDTPKLLVRGTLAFVAGGFAFQWWLVAATLPILIHREVS